MISPVEKQVLEHPATLKGFLFVLVPFISLFNIYVSFSGRFWASWVLNFQLLGFILVLWVMKSRLLDLKKMLIYRYVLRFQLLVFGVYILGGVGVLHQADVSPWTFLFLFLLSLWMPDRLGVSIALAFNFALIFCFLATGLDVFWANQAYWIRFFIAVGLFSLLTLGTALVRRSYLSGFFAARAELKESERKYRAQSRKLIQEIQQRDRVEKQLLHAIKMETVGRVAAGVAHDLNNILSGLVTYPDLILLDMDKDDPLKDALETIKSSGLKAAAIVDDLLTLSRRGVVTAVPMDIQQIAESYLGSPEHRQFMAAHKSISIRTQFEPCSKTVIGSPVHLSKTLMNLLTNGVEAISGTGEILIRIREQVLSQPQKIIYPVQGYFKIPKGEYILFSISDNGAGIAPEEIESIFEPFYTSKQMGRSGTGLGMALVMGAVNDHKGFIQVESTLGQGTCVDIYFPAVVQARESGKEVKNRLVKGKNQHLLVVDDDPVQLEIACRLLERLGYRVHCCASGEEGLEFLNRNPVDLVILDIIMEPGMDGVAVCEQILKKTPDQAVLFVTGFSDAATLGRARRLSRGNCLFKPYSLDRMGAMVEARLRARRPALQ